MADIYTSIQLKPLLWFTLIIITPLGQEIVFRGFVFKGIQNSKLGATGAIIITAFITSVLDFPDDIYRIIPIFLAGLLLGIARFKSNSIYVPITMVSLINLISTIEMVVILGI